MFNKFVSVTLLAIVIVLVSVVSVHSQSWVTCNTQGPTKVLPTGDFQVFGMPCITDINNNTSFADVKITISNQTNLWYLVTVNPIGRVLNQQNLYGTFLLAPQQTRTITDSGIIRFVDKEQLKLYADGTSNSWEVAVLDGMEILWRIVHGDHFPISLKDGILQLFGDQIELINIFKDILDDLEQRAWGKLLYDLKKLTSSEMRSKFRELLDGFAEVFLGISFDDLQAIFTRPIDLARVLADLMSVPKFGTLNFVAVGSKDHSLKNYLTSYLPQGWNFIYSTVGPVTLSDISGCNFDSAIWKWSWSDSQWYQANTITPFEVIALHVTDSCTARVPGTPQSGVINFSKPGWWILSSTKSWNQLAGSCRLVNGPMYYTESGMVTISSGEAMDGFKAYFVEVSDVCTTNYIASLTSTNRSTQQSAAIRIAQLGVLKSWSIFLKLDQSELRMKRIDSIVTKDRVRFRVQGSGVTSIQVRIFDLSGKQVFDSPENLGTALDWHYPSSIANGIYLYVVTVKGTDGRRTTSKTHKLVVLR